MLLFTRIVTPVGSPRRTLAFAAEATAYVNANSSLQTTAWAANFGFPIGTIGWSALVDSQAELAAATSALLGQGAYLDLIESAADLLVQPGTDHLREIIYGQPGEPPAVGSVAVTTTATAVVDRMTDALTWSVEIAKHVEGVVGSPVAVLTDLFGTMGQITWIGVAPDIATADANRMATKGDTGYLAKLAGSAGLFIPGSGHISQVTRFA